jgi:hypothetical protein
MANPTTNYGFVLPTSSDLVTDLPADFDVALQGVDTRLKALQPGTTLGDIAYSSATANTNTRLPIGTTGQVLTVTGGVPTWGTPNPGDITGVSAGVGISGGGTSGDVTVTNSMATAITTNGDLIYGTGSGTFTRRGVGSTGDVLTVSGGVPTWAAPSSALTIAQIATGTLSGASVTVSSLSSYNDIWIRLAGVDPSQSAINFIRPNNNSTTASYIQSGYYNPNGGAPGIMLTSGFGAIGQNVQQDLNATGGNNVCVLHLSNCKSAGFTTFEQTSLYSTPSSGEYAEQTAGVFLVSAAISSVVFILSGGTYQGGTYTVWGG